MCHVLSRTGARSAVRTVVMVAAALAATIGGSNQLLLHDLVEARVGEIETGNALDALGGAALLLLELLLALHRDLRLAQVAIIYTRTIRFKCKLVERMRDLLYSTGEREREREKTRERERERERERRRTAATLIVLGAVAAAGQ